MYKIYLNNIVSVNAGYMANYEPCSDAVQVVAPYIGVIMILSAIRKMENGHFVARFLIDKGGKFEGNFEWTPAGTIEWVYCLRGERKAESLLETYGLHLLNEVNKALYNEGRKNAKNTERLYYLDVPGSNSVPGTQAAQDRELTPETESPAGLPIPTEILSGGRNYVRRSAEWPVRAYYDRWGHYHPADVRRPRLNVGEDYKPHRVK